MSKNLSINVETFANLLDIPLEEAKEYMELLKYTTIFAMSDGEELVVFLPDKNSPNIQAGKEAWDDLMKDAPTRERLIELGIIKKR